MRIVVAFVLSASSLEWVFNGVSAEDVQCAAAGTILGPLTSNSVTLHTLTADLTIRPDCHVFMRGSTQPKTCKVKKDATLKFWLTTNCTFKEGEKTNYCKEDPWLRENAKIEFVEDKDPLSAIRQAERGSHHWGLVGNKFTSWTVNLTSEICLGTDQRPEKIGRVTITWRDPAGPVGKGRIHLHTNINEMVTTSRDDKECQDTSSNDAECSAEVDGAGQGASSLEVGTTTLTSTTITTTMCQWTVKPCGQCLATPVEYCPANPSTRNAMLGPVSGISHDTPALDTSAFGRRLAVQGCVAAATLYPEIVVCNDADCNEIDPRADVVSGKRVKITLKISNFCADADHHPREAGIRSNANITLTPSLAGALTASSEIDRTEEGGLIIRTKLFPKRPEPRKSESEPFFRLEAGRSEILAEIKALVTAVPDHYEDPLEIQADLSDRSVGITAKQENEEDYCDQEEGTAWGSAAFLVHTTTSTVTRTSTTRTQTTSRSSTMTTTSRPCACFEVCCEDKPVQGVHLPVLPNVCPEWWQGKMTGRAWSNSSDQPSDLEQSLRMKRGSDSPSDVSLERKTSDPSSSDRIFFRNPTSSDRVFFRKWSEAQEGSVSASQRPWIEVCAIVSITAVLSIAVLRRSRSTRPSTSREESAEAEVEALGKLLLKEEASDGCL